MEDLALPLTLGLRYLCVQRENTCSHVVGDAPQKIHLFSSRAIGVTVLKNEEFDEAEIARRRDDAIRRALNTPPKPHKEMVGVTERAQAQQESRVKKSARSQKEKA